MKNTYTNITTSLSRGIVQFSIGAILVISGSTFAATYDGVEVPADVVNGDVITQDRWNGILDALKSIATKIQGISSNASGNVGIGRKPATLIKADIAGKTRIDEGLSYDIWLQGGSATSGNARNLGLLGQKSTDKLIVNYNNEYTGGVNIQSSLAVTGTVSGSAPTENNHFTTKAYVDNQVAASSDWMKGQVCPAGKTLAGYNDAGNIQCNTVYSPPSIIIKKSGAERGQSVTATCQSGYKATSGTCEMWDDNENQYVSRPIKTSRTSIYSHYCEYVYSAGEDMWPEASVNCTK